MELAVALGIGGAALVVGYGVACHQWGKHSAKRQLLAIKEARTREAMEHLSSPLPTDPLREL